MDDQTASPSLKENAIRLVKARKRGVTKIHRGLQVDVLEEKGEKTHKHIVGSFGGQEFPETSFTTGPVFTAVATDALIDVDTGVILVGGRVIFESFVTGRLIDRFAMPSKRAIAEAGVVASDRIVLPLATQRTLNYCRWWLDSMSKIFLAQSSNLVRENLRSTSLDVVTPVPATKFQRESIELFNWRALISTMNRSSLLRGRAITSSGLTIHGGQRIGSIVCNFAAFMDGLIPPLPSRELRQNSDFIYISRNEAPMRRILNEDEIVPGLRDLGFKIIKPAELSLREQIEIFRNARVILGAHGAGLTNILFCRPGTRVIEVFPEGGVHGSAFVRLSSHFEFPYYFAVGQGIANGQTDPRNHDIVLPAASFLAFVREAIA